MFGFICFLIFLALFSSWITFRWTFRNTFKHIKHLTEIENYPLIGSAHLFFGLTAEECFKIFVTQASKLVSPTKLWIFAKLLIILDDPDDIQKVLTSQHCLEKGAVYENFRNDHGLITAKPLFWKPARKFLNSTFSLQMLRSFMSTFNENSHDLIKDLEHQCGQKAFDIFEIVGKRSVDLQMRTSFGVKMDPSHITTLYKNMKELLQIFGDRFIKVYCQAGFALFKNTKLYQRDVNIRKENSSIIDPMFAENKEAYIEQLKIKDTSMETDDEFSKVPEIFIRRLAQLTHKGYLDEAHINDHIETMLLAGGDTLAISISTIILCLAMYPDIQEKCIDELREIFTSKDDDMDFDHVSNMKYLDMVCKEALRLIPTVPVVVRKCRKDTKITTCTVPSGADIFVLIINLHKRKDIWGPNADQFDPNNFLPENIEKRHKLAYIPFSYGPRNCIAMKYAVISLRIIIARLLMSYKFSTHLKMEDLKFGFGITIHVLNKHMVQVEKRNF